MRLMPNSHNKLVDALVEAFNVNNCTRGVMDTNFITDGYHITTTFGGSIEEAECKKYLKSLRDAIEDTFHQSCTGETQGPFYLKNFPFYDNAGKIFKDPKIGKFKYEVPIADEVLFNLQAHLIYSMTKPIRASMGGDTHPHLVKNKKYIMCSRFANEEIAKDFKQKFYAEMLRELRRDLSSFVTVEGRNLYIGKDLVSDLDFIQRCVLYNAGKIGCALEIPSADYDGNNIPKRELNFQELLTQIIYRTTDIVIDSYYHAFSQKSRKRCILVPAIAVNDERGKIQYFRYLNASEAQAINAAFDSPVVSNLAEDISDESIISKVDKGNFGINSINFSNREVSRHVCKVVFSSATAVQVNEDEYGLEVQSSPRIDTLRAKVTEIRKKEARLHTRVAQSCVNITLSSIKLSHLRTESTRLREEAAQLRKEIEAEEKRQNLSSCNPGNQFSWWSSHSGSSDGNDNHRNISSDLQGGQQGASRSNPAGPSSSNDFGIRKGQGHGDSQDEQRGHRSTKLPYGTHPYYAVDPGCYGSSSSIAGGLLSKTAANSSRTNKLKKPDSKKCSSVFKWVKSFFSSSKKDTTLKHANSKSGVFVNTPGQTSGSTRKSPNGLPGRVNTNLTGVRAEQTANIAKESCIV
ncbi:Hypothetical protein CINCED_3A020037 [Cinara cedri]|uniref:Uncharacterized protein n=1 Tax=Cinara cedri TaxID=506608 RepID=A0A5E4M5D6_9HEMI|nr:Hypothetical protein CINCED_3A020037 [Cinara cedri]